MTMFALIDAEGHYGDRADVYDVYEVLEDACRAAYRWNKRGKHRVQIVEGELDTSAEVNRSAIGTVYPRIPV